MKPLIFFLKYILYRFRSNNAHGIHSPFVFQLYNEVINQKGTYYSFDKIEHLRKKLLLSKKKIEVTDFGTGKSGKRTIGEIAARSLKSKKYGQLLFRIAYQFKPDTILELGTSLGVTTGYLASANPKAKVITLEGCPQIAAEAKKSFKELSLTNIETVIGNFDQALPAVLCHPDSYRGPTAVPIAIGSQLVFIDGNHRKDATLRYFTQCLEYATNDSIFIFDDIHWSDEMEEAWETIKAHPKVTVTIDLFFLGIVFFRKEQVKEHFTLKM